MKKIGILFLCLASGYSVSCSTSTKTTTREISFIQRAPSQISSEVTTQSPYSDSTTNNAQGARVEFLTPNLEIPQGSRIQRSDISEESKKCELGLNKDGLFSSLSEGVYLLKEPWASSTLMGSGSFRSICAGSVCTANEILPDPKGGDYNIIRRTIYSDSTFTKVEGTVLEIRYGPRGQKPENMALQMRFTCTREFLGF